MDMTEQHLSRQAAFDLAARAWLLDFASENQLADQDNPYLPAFSSWSAAQTVSPDDHRGDDDPRGKEHGLEAIEETESEHASEERSPWNVGFDSSPDMPLGVDVGNSDPASLASASSQSVESPTVTPSASPELAVVVLGDPLAIPTDSQVPAEVSATPLQTQSVDAPGMAISAFESASMTGSSLFCALPDATAAESIFMAGDDSSAASTTDKPARLIELRGDARLYKISRNRYEADVANGDDHIKIDLGRRGLWGYRALGVEAHQEGVQVVLRDKDAFGLAVFNEQGHMTSVTALTGGQLRRCEMLFDQDLNRDGRINNFSARISMPRSGISSVACSLGRQSLVSVDARPDFSVSVENASIRLFVD